MSTSVLAARAGAVAVLCVCLFSVSCDTTQPASITEQAFGFSLRTTGASAKVFDVYQMFVDNDGDGLPDDISLPTDGVPDLFTWCVLGPGTAEPTSFPYPFAIDVEVVRAGETSSEQITSGPAGIAPRSITFYDETPVDPGAAAPALADIDFGGDTYKFEFLHRTSSVNREVIAATSNPLSDADPVTYGYGAGLCSFFDPGAAAIDGTPLPLLVDFAKGDTIVVRVRKGDLDDLLFVLPPPSGSPLGTPPAALNGTVAIITGEVSLDGQVINNVNGTLISSADEGSEFSFSLTAN